MDVSLSKGNISGNRFISAKLDVFQNEYAMDPLISRVLPSKMREGPHFLLVLSRLECKSRDSYLRHIDFPPKPFITASLSFCIRACHVYNSKLVLNLPLLFQGNYDVIVTSIKTWCALYPKLVYDKMVEHVL